jgi:hypothetical protein
MSVMWMPPQTTTPPFTTARRAAGPHGAQLPRKLLCREVARARERMHAPPLAAGHLREQVRCGAEAVDAELTRLAAGHLQCAPADQPGAHQGREVDRVLIGAQRQAEVGLGDHVAGEAAVAGVAGELRRVAQVLVAIGAVAAMAAGVRQPRHADTLPDMQPADPRPERLDHADDLVPRHDRQPALRQFAVDHVQVGAAHGASQHAQAHLAGKRLRRGPFLQHQGLPRRVQHHRVHRRPPFEEVCAPF